VHGRYQCRIMELNESERRIPFHLLEWPGLSAGLAEAQAPAVAAHPLLRLGFEPNIRATAYTTPVKEFMQPAGSNSLRKPPRRSWQPMVGPRLLVCCSRGRDRRLPRSGASIRVERTNSSSDCAVGTRIPEGRLQVHARSVSTGGSSRTGRYAGERAPPVGWRSFHFFRGRLGTNARNRRGLSTVMRRSAWSLMPAAFSFGTNTVNVLE
jgi:hypothetical protein